MGEDKEFARKRQRESQAEDAGEHGRETTPASLPQQHYSACSVCKLPTPTLPNPLPYCPKEGADRWPAASEAGTGGQSSLAHGRGDRWGLVGLEAGG